MIAPIDFDAAFVSDAGEWGPVEQEHRDFLRECREEKGLNTDETLKLFREKFNGMIWVYVDKSILRKKKDKI